MTTNRVATREMVAGVEDNFSFSFPQDLLVKHAVKAFMAVLELIAQLNVRKLQNQLEECP